MDPHKNNANVINDRLKPADVVRLLPVIFFVSVIFLLVRVHSYTMPLSRFSFMPQTDDSICYDCFSYVKSVAVMISGAASVLLLLYFVLAKKRRIRKTILYIPMAVYAFFIVLSYVLSDYKDFALFGTYDRFEGTLTHLCYLVMMFYAMNMIDSKKELKLVFDTLFAGVTVACLVGLSQFFGCDFFASAAGAKIAFGDLSENSAFNFAPGKVYQTVYNLNYVPFYLCLVIPLVICRLLDAFAAIKEQKEKNKRQIIYICWLSVLLLMIVINVAGADSVGSLPGLVFAVAASFIVGFDAKKRRAGFAALACIYAVGFVCMASGFFTESLSPFSKPVSDRPDIEYIRTDSDSVEFCINGTGLVARYEKDGDAFVLDNGEGRKYPVYTLPQTPGRYELDNKDLGGVVSVTPFSSDGHLFVTFDTKDRKWTFEYTGDGFKYVNDIGKLTDLEKVEHAGIISNYAFASGRGYIWDTTIPLLADRIIYGSGADTFMFVFPQDDQAVRYSNDIEADTVYDKPHDMYLQLAESFGIAGLLAFLVMMFFVIKQGIKKEKNIAFLCIGAVAFLIAAVFNDSSVQVMPMFYGLIGCACALYQSSSVDVQ